MAEEGSEFWFWAGVDGALKTVEQKELLISLSNGTIPGKAFVWRQGWRNWLVAGQVAELVNAVPAGSRGPVVAPTLDPKVVRPPPVPGRADSGPIIPVDSSPINDKPGTQLLIEVELGALELEPVAAKHTPPPPPPSRRRQTNPGGFVAPIIPVDSNPLNDRPITGIIDDSEIVIEQAVPAAPAGKWSEVKVNASEGISVPTMPTAPIPSSPSLDSLARAVEAKRPARAPALMIKEEPPQPDSEGPTEIGNAIIPVSDPEHDAPTTIHAGVLRNDPAAPLPSWSEEVDRAAQASEQARWPVAAPTPVPPPAEMRASFPSYQAVAAPKRSSALPLVLGGLALFGLLGAAAAGGLFYFKPWEKVTSSSTTGKPPATATATAPVVAPPPAGLRCIVARESKRLAPAVVVGVPPYVAPLAGTTVAVGIAESATSGTGLEVDIATLEAKRVFSAPPGGKIVGVVPLAKGTFNVDREGGSLGVPHTVNAPVPFVLGFGPAGYARQAKDGALAPIWEGVNATEKASEARVASVDKVGHIVTFRTGGQVRAGWVDADGARKTNLGTVEAQGSKFGSPNVAVNSESALITFAASSGASGPWTVQLASAKHGQLPSKAKPFELPSGGPGGDAIAPVATGLENGHWLLQWTEGPSGSRRVRSQVLDKNLAPVGDALQLSADGKEAGQGVVAALGDKALSLQLVKGDTGYELWGTALSCE